MTSWILGGFCFAMSAFLIIGLITILIRCVTTDPLSTGGTKQWPPIDDDEFIRRCRPGVNREIALRVRQIVSEQLGIIYERVYPEQEFVRDLGCD